MAPRNPACWPARSGPLGAIASREPSRTAASTAPPARGALARARPQMRPVDPAHERGVGGGRAIGLPLIIQYAAAGWADWSCATDRTIAYLSANLAIRGRCSQILDAGYVVCRSAGTSRGSPRARRASCPTSIVAAKARPERNSTNDRLRRRGQCPRPPATPRSRNRSGNVSPPRPIAPILTQSRRVIARPVMFAAVLGKWSVGSGQQRQMRLKGESNQ